MYDAFFTAVLREDSRPALPVRRLAKVVKELKVTEEEL